MLLKIFILFSILAAVQFSYSKYKVEISRNLSSFNKHISLYDLQGRKDGKIDLQISDILLSSNKSEIFVDKVLFNERNHTWHCYVSISSKNKDIKLNGRYKLNVSKIRNKSKNSEEEKTVIIEAYLINEKIPLQIEYTVVTSDEILNANYDWYYSIKTFNACGTSKGRNSKNSVSIL